MFGNNKEIKELQKEVEELKKRMDVVQKIIYNKTGIEINKNKNNIIDVRKLTNQFI